MITKDALYPGRYKLPDGRTFVCEAADIPHYNKRLKAWLAARLPVPVRWEHELDTENAQLSAADKAKNTIAHIADAVVNKDGYLEVKFPADDEEDVKKLRKTKFVSPTIKWDVVDSTGQLWPGPSITEIAVTPVPIQHQQKAFSLSQASIDALKEMPPVYLSLDAYTPIKPVKLAANMPPGAETEPELEEDAEVEDADAAADEEGGEAEEAVGCAEKLKAALEHLKSHGLELGDDVPDDFEQFLDRLIASLKTKKAAENPIDLNGAQPAGGEGPTEVQGPVMMSGALADATREVCQLKLDNLWRTKRITKPMFDKAVAELKTVKLSMTKDGKPYQVGLLAKIAAWEELPENLSKFERTDLSRANEVDEPPEARRREGDEKKQKEAGTTLGALANGTAKRRTNNDRI